MNNLLASNIKTKRLERGYKQEVLALECNMTQANISHIEKGKVKPSVKGIKKIAKVFGITPEELKYGVKIEHKNEINPNYQSKNNIESSQRFYEEIEKRQPHPVNSLLVYKRSISSCVSLVPSIIVTIGTPNIFNDLAVSSFPSSFPSSKAVFTVFL